MKVVKGGKNNFDDIVKEDFGVMCSMLQDIQDKIKEVCPLRQIEFIKPIKYLILEAWMDAKNPDDTFLYANNLKSIK